MKEEDIREYLEFHRNSTWSHVRRERPHEVYIETEDFCGECIEDRIHVVNIPEYRRHLQELINEIDSLDRDCGDWVIVEEFPNGGKDRVFYSCTLDEFYMRKKGVFRDR